MLAIGRADIAVDAASLGSHPLENRFSDMPEFMAVFQRDSNNCICSFLLLQTLAQEYFPTGQILPLFQ